MYSSRDARVRGPRQRAGGDDLRVYSMDLCVQIAEQYALARGLCAQTAELADDKQEREGDRWFE
jgi:hypothetical protein